MPLHTQTHEYKVVTQADKAWGDSFEPWKLQQFLNASAEKGWRVITIAAGDFGDWTTALTGNKRGQLIIVLEREFKPAEPYQADEVVDEEVGYIQSRVPAQRWYADIGSISTILVQEGYVTKQQMDEARREFGKRGGHLADHLLALGYIDEPQLRVALGKPAP